MEVLYKQKHDSHKCIIGVVRIILHFLLLCGLVPHVGTCGRSESRRTYRAAVYEHAVIIPLLPALSRREAVRHMMKNLDVYKTQAETARKQGVDILVFPEDGIYGPAQTRHGIRHYLESIPDPTQISWIPCQDPTRYHATDAQIYLSCLARNNSLYLIANMGDKKACESPDPNCPSDGQYQYNTDVVYDRTGRFLARYHKQNLFDEAQFDKPVHPEYIYFDTEFGRFGVFTCFDILFHEPAVTLVELYKITDVVFPTAWMDQFPYFPAIAYHSSFAVTHNVNLLAANLHIPLFRFHGSGIYTPEGAIQYYYDAISLHGKLLISDVPIIRRPFSNEVHPWRNIHPIQTYLGTKHSSNQQSQKSFHSVVFNDWYNFVLLNNDADDISVCQSGFCCYLGYKKETSNDTFAFGVFNGYHGYQGNYYLQICILLHCQSDVKETCGTESYSSVTNFEQFYVRGTFAAPYVQPQILLTDGESLHLPDKGTWTFDTDRLKGSATSLPLLSVALVGRPYVRG